MDWILLVYKIESFSWYQLDMSDDNFLCSLAPLFCSIDHFLQNLTHDKPKFPISTIIKWLWRWLLSISFTFFRFYWLKLKLFVLWENDGLKIDWESSTKLDKKVGNGKFQWRMVGVAKKRRLKRAVNKIKRVYSKRSEK